MLRARVTVAVAGVLGGCREMPVAPAAPLPIYAVTDTLLLTAAFGPPAHWPGYEPPRTTIEPVTTGRGMLRVAGQFWLSGPDFPWNKGMSVRAVRTRYYSGVEPADSVGEIRVQIRAPDGGPNAAVAPRHFETHVYGMVPGEYRLQVELEGQAVYDRGLVLDSLLTIE